MFLSGSTYEGLYVHSANPNLCDNILVSESHWLFKLAQVKWQTVDYIINTETWHASGVGLISLRPLRSTGGWLLKLVLWGALFKRFMDFTAFVKDVTNQGTWSSFVYRNILCKLGSISFFFLLVCFLIGFQR